MIDFPINLELANYQKDKPPQCIYHSLFNEVNSRRINCKIFYTDGSVTDGRAGCSAVSDDNCY